MVWVKMKKATIKYSFLACLLAVGVAGFEPATPCSQSRCANRTALYPDVAEKGGFEPPVQFPVRQFSKLLVSATHPPLPLFAKTPNFRDESEMGVQS